MGRGKGMKSQRTEQEQQHSTGPGRGAQAGPDGSKRCRESPEPPGPAEPSTQQHSPRVYSQGNEFFKSPSMISGLWCLAE